MDCWKEIIKHGWSRTMIDEERGLDRETNNKRKVKGNHGLSGTATRSRTCSRTIRRSRHPFQLDSVERPGKRRFNLTHPQDPFAILQCTDLRDWHRFHTTRQGPAVVLMAIPNGGVRAYLFPRQPNCPRNPSNEGDSIFTRKALNTFVFHNESAFFMGKQRTI